MIALIQRVSSASVVVDGETVGAIDRGLLALTAVQPGDDEAAVLRMADKLCRYRVFADEAGKMNRSLADIEGDLLLVSQFTLAADTRAGLRPSFSSAAPPELARRLFDELVTACRARLSGAGARVGPKVETGRFGADMKVSLVNDGPVTFWLEV